MKQLLLLAGLLLLVGCKSDQKEKSDTESAITPKSTAPKAELRASIERGKEVYTSLCIACHMGNGQGVKGVFPPLDGSDWLTERREESIHSVKYGQQGEIVVNGETYNGVMAPLGLSDEEVADVLNYVMNSWSNSQEEMVTVEEVAGVN